MSEKKQPVSQGPQVRGPQQKKRYSFKTHGRPISASFGQMLFKPIANVALVRPRWNGNIPLTIKILPNFDYDVPGKFAEYRYSEDRDDFTDWVRAIYVADYVGQEGREVTFALFDPRWREEGYTVETNPYHLLWRAFRQALREGAAYIGEKNVMTTFWARLDAEKRISKPKHVYLVQAVVYANNDAVYVQGGKPPLGAGPDDRLQVVLLGELAWRSLAKILDERHEQPLTDKESWEAVFVCGDITRIDGGKFVTVYRPSTHGADLPRIIANKMAADVVTEDFEDFEETRDGDGLSESYVAVVHDEFYYTSKGQRRKRHPSLSTYSSVLSSRIAWWDDILHFPSHEEIAEILARAFVNYPGLLYYAWKDYPEYFTAEVKSILSHRAQVPVTRADEESRGDELPVEDGLAAPSSPPVQSSAKVSHVLSGIGGALDTDEFEDLAGDSEEPVNSKEESPSPKSTPSAMPPAGRTKFRLKRT